ncbi:hypothetical protein BJY04DRAFT_223828 [Aspergillus karnatakaensis]|uniref:uncharacterized protein n=1 Tax=Aspergillus karnatakaensis TaxID=1810916 RepID=UPI003CCDCEE1
MSVKCTMLLAAMPLHSTPASQNPHVLPTDWAILLIHPGEKHCDWIFSSGGPRTKTGYSRKWLEDQRLRTGNCFEKFELLGYLTDEDIWCAGGLRELWAKTPPGPSQFFILRFLSRLVDIGLVQREVLKRLVGVAEYSLFEWSCNKDRLTRVDQAFVDGREVDECWI